MTDNTELQEELSADEEFAALTAEQEGKDEGKEPEPAKAEATTVKVGDKEYAPDELATLLAEVERAREIEKGGRQKFEEASALQKQIEAKQEQLADMQVIWNAWQNGTDAEKRLILQELSKEVGGEIDETELTDNEAALKRTFEARINRLEAVIQKQSAVIEKVVPTLEELRQYTGSKKEAEQMQANITEIKTKTGMDVSPELLQTWKENGITDPVKAALGVMYPMLQAAQKSTSKPDKQDEIPATVQTNTFDPDDPDLDPDEMLRRLQLGHTPIR